MLNEEQIAAYREMAKNASENSMESQIRANLEATCDKFTGNEDKFDRCMAFLNKVCMEMLGGADAAEDVQDENYKKLSGEIPDEVCFRICRDYFNDEIWKAEDEEEARKKAEDEERAKAKAEKEKPTKRSGWKIRTLLSPTVMPGEKVKVESRVITGWFRVERIQHSGDYMGDSWVSEMELVENGETNGQ